MLPNRDAAMLHSLDLREFLQPLTLDDQLFCTAAAVGQSIIITLGSNSLQLPSGYEWEGEGGHTRASATSISCSASHTSSNMPSSLASSKDTNEPS